MHHLPSSIGKYQTLVTTSTEVVAQRGIVGTPTRVPIVEEAIHNSNVTKNKQHLNYEMSYAQPQQQHKTCVAAPNDLKRVHAPADMEISKVVRLCECTQQHHEVRVAAGKGERAERATLKIDKVKVAELCARAPQHHKVCVAAASEECTVRAQHASTHTQPGAPATTLANSPINIEHLIHKLYEYTQINREIAEELRKRFHRRF
jgi:hypothetical protein